MGIDMATHMREGQQLHEKDMIVKSVNVQADPFADRSYNPLCVVSGVDILASNATQTLEFSGKALPAVVAPL